MKKGFGFVEFYDHEDAKDAVDQMNGEITEVRSKIVVEMAEDRTNNRERPTRGPQKNDKCFNCGGKGHWANECKNGSRCRRRSSTSSSSRSSSSRSRHKKSKKNKHRRRRRSPSSSSSSSRSSSTPIKKRDKKYKRKKKEKEIALHIIV